MLAQTLFGNLRVLCLQENAIASAVASAHLAYVRDVVAPKQDLFREWQLRRESLSMQQKNPQFVLSGGAWEAHVYPSGAFPEMEGGIGGGAGGGRVAQLPEGWTQQHRPNIFTDLDGNEVDLNKESDAEAIRERERERSKQSSKQSSKEEAAYGLDGEDEEKDEPDVFVPVQHEIPDFRPPPPASPSWAAGIANVLGTDAGAILEQAPPRERGVDSISASVAIAKKLAEDLRIPAPPSRGGGRPSTRPSGGDAAKNAVLSSSIPVAGGVTGGAPGGGRGSTSVGRTSSSSPGVAVAALLPSGGAAADDNQQLATQRGQRILAKNLDAAAYNRPKASPFFHFKKLKALVLSKNKLRFLDETSFLGLDSLQTLYLSNNRIQRLAPFRILPALKTLVLDFNRVSALDEFAALANNFHMGNVPAA